MLVSGWSPRKDFPGVELVRAEGARLTATGDGQDWLLVLGYELRRKGRHHRPAVRVDYTAGDRSYTARFDHEAVLCSGRRVRRGCSLRPAEAGERVVRLGRLSARWAQRRRS